MQHTRRTKIIATIGPATNRPETIEKLMSGVQAVSNNIAHDLRTPLSRLRQRLEDLQRTELTAQGSERLESCLAEADRMLSTFNALLRIARI